MKFNNIEEIKIYKIEYAKQCGGKVRAYPIDMKEAVCKFYEATYSQTTSLHEFAKKINSTHQNMQKWLRDYEAGLYSSEGGATHVSQKALSSHQLAICKMKQDINRKEESLKRQLEELEKEKNMMEERIAFINQAEKLGISVSL